MLSSSSVEKERWDCGILSNLGFRISGEKRQEKQGRLVRFWLKGLKDMEVKQFWRELLGLEKTGGRNQDNRRMHQRGISEMKRVRVMIMCKVWLGWGC